MRLPRDPLTDGAVTLRPAGDPQDPHEVRLRVESGGRESGGGESGGGDDGEAGVGEVALLLLDGSVGQLSWSTLPTHRNRGLATRAVRLLTAYALGAGGLGRVQAYVDPGDTASMRIAGRSGLRREGVLRGLRADSETRRDLVVFARLADDPDPREPEGFRALLNAGLPRKRMIAQLAVRDHAQRLLLCNLTYKPDWDLPGGVVEVGESPRVAAGREIGEELALRLPVGALLVVDWLPPWSGWDDACVLVFDGGTHDPGLLARMVTEPREIVTAQFCDAEQLAARCADFTARRALAVLAARPGSPRYLESGRPVE